MNKEHNCKSCEYYYGTSCEEASLPKYNPLSDTVTRDIASINKPCCGYDPGGVILDPDCVKCHNYKSK